MNSKNLHILLLEDNQTDAEFIERELRRGSIHAQVLRVNTKNTFIKALDDFKPDLILADYNLPAFDGLSALKVSKQRSPDVPFIIVSGFLGEELAVDIVKNGATDYILKDRLSRLVPSVTRAIKESDERSQRKRVEEQLRQSEEQYRLLFEGNPEPMWVYDLDTYHFLAVNESAVKHYGFTYTEFLSMTIMDIHPESEIALFKNYHEKIIKTSLSRGIGRAGLWRHKKKDNSGLFVEITWNSIPFMGKQGVLVLANDVTERKIAEDALQESERKLRQIIDLVPHFIFVKSSDGHYLLVNKAVADAYGTTISDLLNKTDFDFNLSHSEASKWREDDLLVINNKETRYIEEQPFTDFNGNKRILYSIKIPFTITGSSTPAVLGMAIDITEQKKSEEKILEQAALLDIATDAIIVSDTNDTILFWNTGAETMYGWKKEEALGQHVSDLLFKHNSAQFEEAKTAILKDQKWSGEIHQITKSEKNIIVQSRWTVVYGENGKIKSFLILNTDITEKKKFEAQFLRAQRMESIGTLASGIAHDLNNVLAPILLTMQNLKKRLPDERTQRLLNTIEVSTQRGADMVQQVLTFTRGVDGEKIMLQPAHLIQEIEKIVRETFSRTIRIQVRLVKDLWMLQADATQLHQVMMNLCVNARDAMPSGGTLLVEADNVTLDEAFARMHVDAKPGPYVNITVSDNGIGIDPEVIDKIFEPFFTTKEIGKGTGLGLSTVLAIVKSHKGFINVYSEVGKGTKFKVYLPAIISPATREATTRKHVELPAGKGETVLVVDDETSICEITKETLENYGYKAMIANDGNEAIALFTQHKNKIGAVLTDMMMPNMDGPSTIKALRKINPRIKIIAASGLITQDKLSEPSVTGVQAFLQKPYTTEKLLTTLRDVLK
ncbi:MAG: PAS domain S-box protein [Bacteroidota bacterium]